MVTALVRSFVLAITATLVAGAVYAQQFPSRPIRILVGYGAGGGTDTLARLYASKLQEVLNTPVVVDNKPGAQELLAAQPVMNAPADGYTLWMGTGGALAQNPGVRRDLPYDLLKNFTPVAMLSEAEAVLFVRSDVPVNSLAELIAYGKAHPRKLNYGSGGIGSGNHLQMEYLSSATGASFSHIPYKSDVEVTRDIMGGNVDMGMIIAQFAVPLIKEGKVKPIAVTGSQRLKELPNLPTVAEAGGAALKGMGSYTFFGVMAPAGLPASVLERLNDAFNKVAAMPDVAQRMRDVMQRPVIATPAEFRQYLERELAKWREVGKTVKVGTT
ncbi:MAG TPA: tripartite tricarboxylate transporter substrate binding protein [Ramlibacter sp.]|nr:tripartite tricarboxylate transporter substrate binding protein [Ramlibacter sp.]